MFRYCCLPQSFAIGAALVANLSWMSSRAYAENRCGSAGEAFDAVFVERLSGYAELVLSDGRRVLLRGVLLPHPSDDGRGKAGVLSHAAAKAFTDRGC